MSGIAGFIYWEKKAVEKNIFCKMMQKIEHRGPDDSHIEINSNVAFGHAQFNLKKKA